jgi:hypothetical protein
MDLVRIVFTAGVSISGVGLAQSYEHGHMERERCDSLMLLLLKNWRHKSLTV